jgi:hypothetical protein
MSAGPVASWVPDATSAAASPRSGLDDERYLYLRCGRGTDAMPYGLAGLLHQRNAASITLVGAVLDVHVLRSHRFADACAPRGTTIAKPSFETLAKLGVEDVTLALDNDNAGRAGASRAMTRPPPPSTPRAHG